MRGLTVALVLCGLAFGASAQTIPLSEPKANAEQPRNAQERSWREDNRRLSNGEQVRRLSGLAMRRGPSVDFGGYWQRHLSA